MLETQIRYRDLLCDFCGSSDPAFVFEAEDFNQQVKPLDEDDHREIHFEGAWNACTDCKELIEEQKSEELLDRSLKQYSVPTTSKVYHKIRDRIQSLHDEFFFCMTGTVVDIGDYVDPEDVEPGVVTIHSH